MKNVFLRLHLDHGLNRMLASFTTGVNTLYCLEEWRGEHMVFTPRGQLGANLGVVFGPWGDFKNWPLAAVLILATAHRHQP
jgi:hypothetical protein